MITSKNFRLPPRTSNQFPLFHIKASSESLFIMKTEFPYKRSFSGIVMSTSAWTLTHWGWVTHICSKLTTIGSDNGLSPGRRQAITWTNGGILLIGPLGINFSEILIEINKFSFNKMDLKMSSAKWRIFRLSLNELSAGPVCIYIRPSLCLQMS